MTDVQQYAAPNSGIGSQTDLFFYDRVELKKTYSPTTSEIHWIDAQRILSASLKGLEEMREDEHDPLPFCLRVIAAPAWSPPANNPLRRSTTTIPIPKEVLMTVATSLEDYESLWQNDAGNAEIHVLPQRFFMQTPNDSWPFCSLIAKTNKPHKPDSDSHSDTDSDTDSDNSWARPFTAILISSDVPIPNHLPALVSSYVAPNSFEGTDAPMIFLPLGFLIHHVRLFSTKLADLTETVSFIEKEVIDANDEADTKNLIKKLHICNRNAAELQRRWHFQLSLSSAIVDLLDHEFHDLRAQNHIRSYESHNRLKNAAALQRKISESLKYDLDAIPKRITNQFNAIFNLSTQRDAQASIKLAEQSTRIANSARKDSIIMKKIADRTSQDSSSMKTIAVMTMVFLPGTFVCSFFSMTMFNWNNQPGEKLVSPYIWAYFVAMVPLTLFVIGFWWVKTKESRRSFQVEMQEFELNHGSTF